MTELIWWVIALGYVVAVGGIFMLSMQIERHAQSMTAMLLHSNEMLLARLDRVENASLHPLETTSGVILERRSVQRRHDQAHTNRRPIETDQRKSSGRRTGDFSAPAQAGYAHL